MVLLALVGSVVGSVATGAAARAAGVGHAFADGLGRTQPARASSTTTIHSLAPDLQAVACSGATSCWGVGEDGQDAGVVPFTLSGTGSAAAGTTAVVGPGKGYDSIDLAAVACPGTTTCIAVGDEQTATTSVGTVVTIVNGEPKAPVPVPSSSVLRGISCPAVNQCLAVGYAGDPSASESGVLVPVEAGEPGTVRAVPGVSELDAVACPAPGSCEAVGRQGTYATGTPRIVPVTGADTPGTATALNGFPGYLGSGAAGTLDGIWCSSAGNCVAVGTAYGPAGTPEHGAGGFVAQIAGGSASLSEAPGAPPALESVGCAEPGTCLAVGENYYQHAQWQGPLGPGGAVPIEGGLVDTPMTVDGTEELAGVACPSAGTCLGVGRNQITGIQGGGVATVFTDTHAYNGSADNGQPCPGSGTDQPQQGDPSSWFDAETASATSSTGPVSGIYATIQAAPACYDSLTSSPTSSWVMLEAAHDQPAIFVQAGIFYPSNGIKAHVFVEADFPGFPFDSGHSVQTSSWGKVDVTAEGSTDNRIGAVLEFHHVISRTGTFAVEDIGPAHVDQNCPGAPTKWQGDTPTSSEAAEEVETTYNGKCLWIFYLPKGSGANLDQWANLAAEVHTRNALIPGFYADPLVFSNGHLYYNGHWRNYFSDLTGDVWDPTSVPDYISSAGPPLTGKRDNAGQSKGCQWISPSGGFTADFDVWSANEHQYCYPWTP